MVVVSFVGACVPLAFYASIIYMVLLLPQRIAMGDPLHEVLLVSVLSLPHWSCTHSRSSFGRGASGVYHSSARKLCCSVHAGGVVGHAYLMPWSVTPTTSTRTRLGPARSQQSKQRLPLAVYSSDGGTLDVSLLGSREASLKYTRQAATPRWVART